MFNSDQWHMILTSVYSLIKLEDITGKIVLYLSCELACLNWYDIVSYI
jgi:hypothetical protein